MSSVHQYRIAIVAPFPHPDLTLEGWMTRISSIDHQFEGFQRIYLHFSERHDDSQCTETRRDPERAEVLLHPCGMNSTSFVSDVVDAVDAVYVHTLHLAEHMLPWLDTGKVYVDIHGVTPEEEEMLGNAHLRERYEAVEQAVLRQAKNCICVSEAMQDHYADKYPSLEPNWLTIPVTPTIPAAIEISRKHASDDRRPVALYSGGTQAWQNLDAMLDLVESAGDAIEFRFISHDHPVIRRRIEDRGLPCAPTVGYCGETELPGAYRDADFGLVLRDDSPVNRVSCPTKLVEYLLFGLIPVVRCPRMGDFHKLGLACVTEEEFRDGFIPDAATRDWMAEHNLDIVRQITEQFRSGCGALREILSGGASGARVSTGTFRDLRAFRRSVLDRHSELPCRILEVGAFSTPTIAPSEADVKFLDYYATEDLKSMARKQGGDPDSVVDVDYVCQNDDYREVVDETCDVLIANHVLEHVDHMIRWLQMVRSLIRDGGLLFLVLPDKKKSFDRFRPDTPLSHFLFEHLAPEQDVSSIHNMETVLYYDESFLGQTNNPSLKLNVERLTQAITPSHPGVHRHVFQAETFTDRLMKPLLYTGLIDYDLLEVNTCPEFGEFAVVLRAGVSAPPTDPGSIFRQAADTIQRTHAMPGPGSTGV